MTTTKAPIESTLSPSDALAGLLPHLRRQVREADPDEARLAELRQLLRPDVEAIESAIPPTPALATRYASMFERDVATLSEFAKARPLDHAIELALHGARGALDVCASIASRQHAALERIRSLTVEDVRHTPPAVLAENLREQWRGLAMFPTAVVHMREVLDARLAEITQRVATAPPSVAVSVPAVQRPPVRQGQAKTGSPFFEERS
jgi:hypothetical protein